jgi:hypothetical protein
MQQQQQQQRCVWSKLFQVQQQQQSGAAYLLQQAVGALQLSQCTIFRLAYPALVFQVASLAQAFGVLSQQQALTQDGGRSECVFWVQDR